MAAQVVAAQSRPGDVLLTQRLFLRRVYGYLLDLRLLR